MTFRALVAVSFHVSLLTAALPARADDRPDKWEKYIAAFEAADKKQAPPRNAVLFVGSSSIVKWKTLPSDFQGIAVINRGFGGSQIADVNRYIDRIVAPYAPRAIVFYCGDNDLAAKPVPKSPETIAKDFQTFVSLVRAKLPEVPIHYIAIKPSLKRAALLDKQQRANRLIREFIDSQPRMTYIDVVKPMLGADGKPRAELFVKDLLHLNAKGYELWKSLVLPVIASAGRSGS